MMEPYAKNLNYTLSMIGEEGAGVEVDDIYLTSKVVTGLKNRRNVCLPTKGTNLRLCY